MSPASFPKSLFLISLPAELRLMVFGFLYDPHELDAFAKSESDHKLAPGWAPSAGFALSRTCRQLRFEVIRFLAIHDRITFLVDGEIKREDMWRLNAQVKNIFTVLSGDAMATSTFSSRPLRIYRNNHTRALLGRDSRYWMVWLLYVFPNLPWIEVQETYKHLWSYAVILRDTNKAFELGQIALKAKVRNTDYEVFSSLVTHVDRVTAGFVEKKIGGVFQFVGRRRLLPQEIQGWMTVSNS
ncbi:MAG: hypothetical protein M1820_010090 [Bogoriella megaspora]|nr:MAG: hypothetical protein M1820_010090 [Bogoriella megaspora]